LIPNIGRLLSFVKCIFLIEPMPLCYGLTLSVREYGAARREYLGLRDASTLIQRDVPTR